MRGDYKIKPISYKWVTKGLSKRTIFIFFYLKTLKKPENLVPQLASMFGLVSISLEEWMFNFSKISILYRSDAFETKAPFRIFAAKNHLKSKPLFFKSNWLSEKAIQNSSWPIFRKNIAKLLEDHDYNRLVNRSGDKFFTGYRKTIQQGSCWIKWMFLFFFLPIVSIKTSFSWIFYYLFIKYLTIFSSYFENWGSFVPMARLVNMKLCH